MSFDEAAVCFLQNCPWIAIELEKFLSTRAIKKFKNFSLKYFSFHNFIPPKRFTKKIFIFSFSFFLFPF